MRIPPDTHDTNNPGVIDTVAGPDINLAGLALLWKNNLSFREMTAASRSSNLESAPELAGESAGEED